MESQDKEFETIRDDHGELVEIEIGTGFGFTRSRYVEDGRESSFAWRAALADVPDTTEYDEDAM